ncbi:c-type cytochrome biogenesis protein CcmI [Carnimonas nigrificans]|uniref:c-type cytochrome biogenesis protein CcmI n=1 Tax=Carnimonas nigrificans TaxID=64323 RepID=UPI00046FAB58|nr:c-type cytochrome biogenesis protein CcmI [Carnimonas nigrificans]
MIALWLGMALLVVVFALFALWAWRLAPQVARSQQRFEQEDSATASNVRVFYTRLAELEQQRDEQQLSAQQFNEARLDLERSLLSDSTTMHKRELAEPYQGSLWWALAIVVAVAVAWTAYLLTGSSSNVELYGVRQSVEQSGDTSPEHYIQRFEAEARQHPSNADVWELLYPLYRDTGRYQDAVHALSRVIELHHAEHDPALLAELAQAKFFAAGRVMNSDIMSTLDEVKRLDPRQPTMHSLLGFTAFTQGNYQNAIDHWRLALAGQSNSADEATLRQGIALARQRLAQADNGGSPETTRQ